MMNKFFSWLKQRFYVSMVGGYYFEFLLWLDRRSSKQETHTQLNRTTQEVNASKEKYDKAVGRINDSLMEQAGEDATPEDYMRVLKSHGEDLLALADNPEEHLARRAEVTRRYAVKKGDKDISSDLDRAKMVESRIEDFQDLRQDKAKRQLHRDLRKAHESGDVKLIECLEKELESKYGRFRKAKGTAR